MPQEHHVLLCFSCKTFQVHIVKKSRKWECKICGTKQSLKRNYGRGSGKDCRTLVMELNKLSMTKDANLINLDTKFCDDVISVTEEEESENKIVLNDTPQKIYLSENNHSNKTITDELIHDNEKQKAKNTNVGNSKWSKYLSEEEKDLIEGDNCESDFVEIYAQNKKRKTVDQKQDHETNGCKRKRFCHDSVSNIDIMAKFE